jgi:4-hydroxybenzoate polyprenyltransferase
MASDNHRLAAESAPSMSVTEKAGAPFLWVRAMRVHQWSKNILLFVPLFVGHAFSAQAIARSAVGFALLCLLSSATYIINDLADLEADRAHPTKRLRPFASGQLTIAHGLIAAPLMMIGALVGAYFLAPAFAAAMLAYLAVTLAYSYRLKRVALLDVFIIGVLFTLRIVMGAEILDLAHSPWLLSFALAFFLSLALGKRHAEVMGATANHAEEIAGRGYRGADWPITLTFGVGVGLLSVVIMLLYMANDAAPSGFYHQLGWLYAIPALMTVWLMRIWLLSHREQLHDDPVIFALRDPASLLLGVAVAVTFYLSL